jgi:hypothetical protein
LARHGSDTKRTSDAYLPAAHADGCLVGTSDDKQHDADARDANRLEPVGRNDARNFNGFDRTFNDGITSKWISSSNWNVRFTAYVHTESPCLFCAAAAAAATATATDGDVRPGNTAAADYAAGTCARDEPNDVDARGCLRPYESVARLTGILFVYRVYGRSVDPCNSTFESKPTLTLFKRYG